MNKTFAMLSTGSTLASMALAMSNADPLGDLGLDLDGAAEEQTVATEEVGAVEDVLGTTEKREEVVIGELEYGLLDFIPTQRRGGGASGSKYKFEAIGAPVAKADGTGFQYNYSLVRLVEGEDADKLKRSVQSATTQANAQAKKDGGIERYITRQFFDKGEFAGVYIIRVDGTQETEEASAEQA